MSRNPMLLSVMLLTTFATTGCELFEWAYVGELKTSGTWTGTASVMTVVVEREGNQTVQVASLHIKSGPEWTDPGHRNRENVIGKYAVLIDDNKRTFPPDKWPQGSLLRVRGLMKSDIAFDQQGRRMYPGPGPKYEFITIRVKAVESLTGTAATPSRALMLTTDATTAPTTMPSMELAARAVSDSQIDLSWTPVAGAKAYRVEISRDGKEFYDSVELDASEPRASNVDLFPNEKFFFRVTAVGENGNLQTSNIADATTLPESPTNKPLLLPRSTTNPATQPQ